MYGGPERRRFRRYPATLGGILVVDGNGPYMPAVLRDVSEGGLCVVTGAGLLKRQWIILVAFIADGEVCCGTGRVVQDSGEGAFGIELDDVSQPMRAFIRRAGADPDPRSVLRTARGLEIRVA